MPFNYRLHGRNEWNTINKIDTIEYIEELCIENENSLFDFNVYKFPLLTKLFIHSSNIKNIEKLIAPKLRMLSIRNCLLSTVDISNFNKLVSVCFDNNNLSKIDISKLPKLKSLSITHNNFTKLPNYLVGLRNLYIAYNKISIIKNINLPELITLNISHNNIQKIKNVVLESLKYLFINGNNISSIELYSPNLISLGLENIGLLLDKYNYSNIYCVTEMHCNDLLYFLRLPKVKYIHGTNISLNNLDYKKHYLPKIKRDKKIINNISLPVDIKEIILSFLDMCYYRELIGRIKKHDLLKDIISC